MNAHAKLKIASLRNEKRMLEQNLETHKKQLAGAPQMNAASQFKLMLEKSITTDTERIEVLAAMIAAVAPLAGESVPAPPQQKPPA